jgi:uncharacterized protein YgbK (DUF1537 family)
VVAKISIGQLEIAVDVLDLGEAMRQLAPYLPSTALAAAHQKSAGMKPTLPMTLATEAARIDAQTPKLQAPSAPTAELTRKLLQLIADHRVSGGATSAQVQEVLGASHPKGIGSKMSPVNNYLMLRGFEPDQVYMNPRNETGGRMWVPGSRLDDALKAVKEPIVPFDELPTQS